MVPTLAAVLSDPLGSWPVWEVALAAVALAVGGAAAAVGLAWRALLLKRAAAAEFAGDETGAGALGAALGSAHPWIDAGTIADVWAAHAALPADRRRELALAVVGLVRGSGPATWYALRESIKSAVRGFVPKAQAGAPDSADAVPRAFGQLLAGASDLAPDTARALSDAYTELLPGQRAAFAVALGAFVREAPPAPLDDLDTKLCAAVAAFRAAPPRDATADPVPASAFGELVCRCAGAAEPDTFRALWAAFAELPPDRRHKLVAVLTELSNATQANYTEVSDAQLLAVAAAFRAPTPELASAHA